MGFARVGLTICFDLRFPNMFQSLRYHPLLEADIILVPSAFTVKTGEAHWKTLLRARAIESQSMVIAAAQSGAKRGFDS
jgi:deaminated glutathione amidase